MPSDAPPRAVEWLHDMLEAIESIESFTAGSDFAQFLADTRTGYAVRYALLMVSEASRRLPDDLKARHSHIPWRNVADLGNVYRHEYHRVSDIAVWKTVTDHLPPLKAVVVAELATLPTADPR